MYDRSRYTSLCTQKITIIGSWEASGRNEWEKDYYLVRISIAIANCETRWRVGYLSKSCRNNSQHAWRNNLKENAWWESFLCLGVSVDYPPTASLYTEMFRLAPAVTKPSFLPVLGSHLTLHSVFTVSVCVATHVHWSTDHTLALPSNALTHIIKNQNSTCRLLVWPTRWGDILHCCSSQANKSIPHARWGLLPVLPIGHRIGQ